MNPQRHAVKHVMSLSDLPVGPSSALGISRKHGSEETFHEINLRRDLQMEMTCRIGTGNGCDGDGRVSQPPPVL